MFKKEKQSKDTRQDRGRGNGSSDLLISQFCLSSTCPPCYLNSEN